MNSLAMTEKQPQQDQEIEELKRQLRHMIAESEIQAAQINAKLNYLKLSLAGLEGVPQSESAKGVWSDMDVGIAIETYLRSKEGNSAERNQIVSDLVMLGVKWDSKARGGASGDINRAITYFLRTGRSKGEKPLLIAEGTKIRLN